MTAAPPDVHATAARAYVDLGPLTRGDADGGWLLLRLVAAALEPLDEVETLARDRDDRPGWSTVVDLDNAPAGWLPWLAQFVGVQIPGGLSDAGRRAAIRDRAASRRGTPTAVIAAVQATLRGSRRVELLERDGSAYRLTVRIYESELVDLATTRAALDGAKPGPVVAVLDVQPGASYAHMTAVHGPSYTDFSTEFDTYADARDHVPET